MTVLVEERGTAYSGNIPWVPGEMRARAGFPGMLMVNYGFHQHLAITNLNRCLALSLLRHFHLFLQLRSLLPRPFPCTFPLFLLLLSSNLCTFGSCVHGCFSCQFDVGWVCSM